MNINPRFSTITINAAGGLVFENLMVDDDATAPSNGNNDDIVNSGETIELWPSFQKHQFYTHHGQWYCLG
jgi:hypothetical protein